MNQSNGGTTAAGDVASLLLGRHVLPLAAVLTAPGLSADQSTYVSEMMGHAKAVTALALLDPAAPGGDSSGLVLLARVSAHSTLRVLDLCSRSCVWVLRSWVPAPTGVTLAAELSGVPAPRVMSLLTVSRAHVTVVRPHIRRHSPGNAVTLLCTLDHFALGADVLDRAGR